jgi:hypothetical protein
VRNNIVLNTPHADIGPRYGIEVRAGTGIRVSNTTR